MILIIAEAIRREHYYISGEENSTPYVLEVSEPFVYMVNREE